MGVFDPCIDALVRISGSNRLASGEQSAAQLQFFFADPIGQETELTDANQSGGQHMEQKAAHELDCIQGHDLGPMVIRVILPLKADTAIFQAAKPMVGDGYSVGIAGQILENALGPAEGRLEVNYPFDMGGFVTQGLERPGLGQGLEFAGEAERAFAESFFQVQ